MARIGEQLPATTNLHKTLSFEVENFEKNMAPNRKTDFGTVLWNMTLGVVSAPGKDLFHAERTQKTVRTIELLKKNCEGELNSASGSVKQLQTNVGSAISQATAFFIGESSNARHGLLAKAGYLGSLAVAGLGYVDSSSLFRWTGITGALLCSGYFFFNAASSSGDNSRTELSGLKSSLRLVQKSLDKETEVAETVQKKGNSVSSSSSQHSAAPSAPPMAEVVSSGLEAYAALSAPPAVPLADEPPAYVEPSAPELEPSAPELKPSAPELKPSAPQMWSSASPMTSDSEKTLEASPKAMTSALPVSLENPPSQNPQVSEAANG